MVWKHAGIWPENSFPDVISHHPGPALLNTARSFWEVNVSGLRPHPAAGFWAPLGAVCPSPPDRVLVWESQQLPWQCPGGHAYPVVHICLGCSLWQHHRLASLNHRNVSPDGSGGWTSEITVSVGWISFEASLLDLQIAIFLLYLFTWSPSVSVSQFHLLIRTADIFC